MSTSVYIAYLDENDCCHFRYHHWDGYPDYLGSLLLSHLASSEKVLSLFALNCNFSTVKTLIGAKQFSDVNGGKFLANPHLPGLAWIPTADDEKFSASRWLLLDFSQNAKKAQKWKRGMEYVYFFHKEEWFISYLGGPFYSLPLVFSMIKPLEKMTTTFWDGLPTPLAACNEFSLLFQKSQQSVTRLLPASLGDTDRDLGNLSALLFNIFNKQLWHSGTDQQSIPFAQKMTDFIYHPDFPVLSTQIISSSLLSHTAQLTQPTTGSSEKKKLKAV